MASRRLTRRSRDRTTGSCGGISWLTTGRSFSGRRSTMQRRTFLQSMVSASIAARHLSAQADSPSWGGPVLDTHLHLRGDADACYTHMQGCGVTRAVLLTPAAAQERAKAEMQKRPDTFVRSVTAD